ncbi:alpha/beta hydrolase fold domain-containing protein [Amnibacterium kyonggiense]|uniref:Acetyl esterase/lipase n=1 Tax=Amnibacterium kyonggiense TaxID=595671 RepID=A0A4R7FQ62_9MICO|nr:alpha/beta hydrolase fold domain-containing protein [Amnibacterium kyonggiense]TDS79917.1 acetyl esterase/lipase [Amnibacterium kyonggiense]
MSVRHGAVRAFIAATGRGRTWRSAEAVDAAIARRDPWPARPPAPTRGVAVAVAEDDGWPLVRLVPPRAEGAIVTLHGGGYVFGPEPQHWTFWRALAVASGREVVAPLYRLAPEGTAAETVPHVARIVRELAGAGPVALVGDSAGGGMALAAAQLLAADGLRPPLLLSAPWLDGAVPAPWRTPRDPWLAAPGLRHAADLYRGDLPVEHPFVSPLLGDLHGLGPIVVASGTRDVLHRDALRLEERCPSPVRVLVGSGLLHNWPLLPIPEARPALRAFVDALR